MFIFSDRKSMRPGRYKATKDNGEYYYVTLERADNPTAAGTPLNAETFTALQNSIQGDISALKSSIQNGTVVAAKATRATQDGNGRNIENTYATYDFVEGAKELSYNLQMQLITSLQEGDFAVAEAERANSLRTDMFLLMITNGKGVLQPQLVERTLYMITCDGYTGFFYYESSDSTNTAQFDMSGYNGGYHGYVQGQNFTVFKYTEGASGTVFDGTAFIFPIATYKHA